MCEIGRTNGNRKTFVCHQIIGLVIIKVTIKGLF